MNPRYTSLLKEVDGDLFSYDEWKEMVRYGAITPDDGSGYVCNEYAYDPISNPFKELPDSGRGVIWFSK